MCCLEPPPGGIRKLVARPMRVLIAMVRRARCAWYRQHFLLSAGLTLSHLASGRGVGFYAPVRGEGAGTVTVGDNVKFGVLSAPRLGNGETLIQARTREAVIAIGKDTWINNNVALVATQRISIGAGCSIGEMTLVVDTDFHEIDPRTRNRSDGLSAPVEIGNNVWLGSRVVVLKGVTIGDGSVIGAMSVVTHPIPANCIAAGNPARVIRHIE